MMIKMFVTMSLLLKPNISRTGVKSKWNVGYHLA